MANSRVIERFLEYVQIDSPTKEERDFRLRLEKDLTALGVSFEADNAGEEIGSNSGNLIAKIPGTGDKTILFSSHMDTVSPGRGIVPQIIDGVITSKSDTILAGDDKAGVSAIIEMLTVLKEKAIPHHNIIVVFTIYEEGGVFGSRNLDYNKIKEADFGIIVDSDGAPGRTILQGPAQNKIDVIFKGKTAHAGMEPEKGVSAIEVAAEAIASMKLGRIDSETTANVGRIEGGGPTNIVTDRVVIAAEARSLDNDKLKAQCDHMVECVKKAQAKHGLEAEIAVTPAYKVFNIPVDSVPAKHIEAACQRAGLKFIVEKSGGGSDANNFNQHGVPSVNLACGMTKVHTTEEFIKVKDIEDTARLLVEIAKA